MERDIDRLALMADRNVCDGVREEPRVWYDQVPLDFSVVNEDGIFNLDSDSFINGERFPVRMTHIVLSLGEQYDAESDELIVDPTLPIQLLEGVDLRICELDSYYMSESYVAVPAWMNKVSSSPTAMGDQGVSYTFDRPVILSSRDSMQVQISALFDTTSVGDFVGQATVSFTGIGVQSKRPVFMSSTVTVTDSKAISFNPSDLQNNGMEPVALVGMAFQQRTSVGTDSYRFTGSVRAWSIQCRQNGNGTNANWFSTPKFPTALARINASNLGVTSGPGIVHELPGDGWLFEPNMGVRIQARVRALAPSEVTHTEIPLLVSLAGYIVVT